MDGILGDLDICVCYIDDILIFSHNLQEHQCHLRTMLEQLRDNGLVITCNKCVFSASAINFLGHHISLSGVYPLVSKVSVVINASCPTSIKQLQEFTWMVNYYHYFIPLLAHTMTPLHSELLDKAKISPLEGAAGGGLHCIQEISHNCSNPMFSNS